MTIVPSKLGSKNGGRPSRHSAWLHDAVAELCPQVRDGAAEGAGQPPARDGDRLVVLLLFMLLDLGKNNGILQVRYDGDHAEQA